jgi:CubicO group peptidase (beta-lactamase class C family)
VIVIKLIKIDLVKNVIGLMAVLVLFCSCKDKNDKKGLAADSAVTSYPAVSTLTPAELSHYKTKAKNFFDSMFGRGNFNGSLLVAKNGEIILEEYKGFRNPRVKKDSITPSTSFHLASISKTITGMAVLKLAEQGKLSIEDSVSKFLAGFPCTGVTIKTLLNHRSGLPNYVHYMENLGWDKKRLITNQDVLNFIIERHKDIDIGTPDRRFSYSNTNYALLALVIEKATGQFFGDYLRQTFFEPLGMKDTYVFTPADSAKSLPSFFYNGRQYAFDFLDLVYGDKNIYSTVRDLLKWDQALHNGFFKKETLDAAYAGYSFERPGVNNYGLGWRMFLLGNGKKFIYHNGWWHGNRTAFYRLIDENVTIIALCNNDSKKVYSSKKLADMFGNYFKNKDEEKETENAGGGSPTL